jgi:TnpA family transposase
VASVERTAYPQFRRMISGRELDEVFTPTQDEVSWARARTTSEQHRLALVVLLKCYQRLGYFPNLLKVPSEIISHVRVQVGIEGDVPAVHEAQATAKWHRGLIRARLGVKYEPGEVRALAVTALREAAQKKDHPADLINAALETLVKERRELPGYTTLDALATRIRTEVNTELIALVSSRLDEQDTARLLGLFAVAPGERRSGYDKLKDTARNPSVSKLKQWLEHLSVLDAVGPTEKWLEGIASTKISHFAGEARVLDASEMTDVSVDKRLTLLICLVHTARIGVRDDVVTMFCKRVATITKRAKDRLEEIRAEHRETSEWLLGVFGEVINGTQHALAPLEGQPALEPTTAMAEQVGRMVLSTLTKAGGLERVAGAHEDVSAHHGNNYAPLVHRFYKSHRSAFFDLIEALELEATSAERSVLEAVAFLKGNQHRTGEYLSIKLDGGRLLDLSFASEAWQKILRPRNKPGVVVRRHFEVCVFSHLAAELRSGDIAVLGSDSYANLHAQLLSWEQCEPEVAGYCAQAGIPATAGEFTAWCKAELARVAARVDTGYPANADLVIDAGGVPVLKVRKGKDRRASARVLEQAIRDRMPQRPLLDIITGTAHRLGWHRHFGPSSGSDPKISDPLGRYSVMALTYGANLGPYQMARHLRGGISPHEISLLGNKHVTAMKLHHASADVINGFAELDLSRMWGTGKVVAADGSQIDTWENNLLAETSIRYGGYGGIAYRHVSDTYIALFSRFIPCGVWEAVYIIDGLLNNESDVQPDTIHADTQGQSLPVFGLATLLGFDLLPRIRNWKDLVFYRPEPGVRYKHIDSLFNAEAVDWGLIETHWPDLMRTVISIREGVLSSETLLRRLGNHSRKNRLYQAFRELGRAIRTIVLLRYLSEPELRESITAVTNKVEAFHGFSQWLMFGGALIGHNDPDYHEKIVKFNELIANCVIYQTTLDITTVANQLATAGHSVDPEDLATISPYLTEHIRRFGEWVLDTTPPDPVATTRLHVGLAA